MATTRKQPAKEPAAAERATIRAKGSVRFVTSNGNRYRLDSTPMEVPAADAADLIARGKAVEA